MNVSQDELVEYYNKLHKTDPITDTGGICWASAQTSVIQYAGGPSSQRIVGSYVIEKALTEGWVETSDTGFNFTHSDTLMNAMFDRFSMKKKANNDRYDIYAELKDEIDDNRVVVFKIRQHEMTGCGYVEYTVKYKEKNWLGKLTERTDTAKFVIVNTTWGEESNYDIAYFPEGEIGTSIGNRWHFGITKYK